MVKEDWSQYLIYGEYVSRRPCDVECGECAAKKNELHDIGCNLELCNSCSKEAQECKCEAFPQCTQEQRKLYLKDNIEVIQKLLSDACYKDSAEEIKNLIKKSFDYLYDSSKILKEL